MFCSQKSLPRTFLSTLRRSSTITASTSTKNTQFSIVMTLAFRFGWNELKILLKAKSRNSRTVIRLIPRKKPNVPPKFPKGKKWQITVVICCLLSKCWSRWNLVTTAFTCHQEKKKSIIFYVDLIYQPLIVRNNNQS